MLSSPPASLASHLDGLNFTKIFFLMNKRYILVCLKFIYLKINYRKIAIIKGDDRSLILILLNIKQMFLFQILFSVMRRMSCKKIVGDY